MLEEESRNANAPPDRSGGATQINADERKYAMGGTAHLLGICPGHRSRNAAVIDARDTPGHDDGEMKDR